MSIARRTLVLALAATLAACGGGSSSSPPSVLGVWSGSYAVVGESVVGDLQLAAMADGSLGVRVNFGEGWGYAVGTHSASGAAVSGEFVPEDDGSPPTYAFAATLTASALTGTLGFSPATSGIATFSLARATGAGEGIYVGAYGSGSETPDLGYLLILYPEGGIEAHDGATLETSRAEGTWSLAGEDFSASYTYLDGGPSYDLLGTLAAGTLSGTWGSPGDGTDGGLFTTARQ